MDGLDPRGLTSAHPADRGQNGVERRIDRLERLGPAFQPLQLRRALRGETQGRLDCLGKFGRMGRRQRDHRPGRPVQPPRGVQGYRRMRTDHAACRRPGPRVPRSFGDSPPTDATAACIRPNARER